MTKGKRTIKWWSTYKESLGEFLSHSLTKHKNYIMNWMNNKQAWEVYVNGTCIRKVYNKAKAINIAQIRCGQLFEQRKTEVVDTITGEVVYQIN